MEINIKTNEHLARVRILKKNYHKCYSGLECTQLQCASGGGGGGHSPQILVGMCHGKVKNGGLRSELERENAGLRSELAHESGGLQTL